MQPLSRRVVALLATTATLGAGSLTTVSLAQGAASPTSSSTVSSERGVLDLLLTTVLGLINIGSTPEQIQGLISTYNLSSAQLGTLLDNAGADQVTALLGGLTPAQLTGAVNSLSSAGELDAFLDTITAGQTGDLLAPLTGDTLGSTLGLLDTSQITGALATLNPTELSSVVDGLTAGQTGAVLGALSAGDPTQLTNVLGVLTPAQLTSSLGTLTPAQLATVLGVLDAGDLTSVVGILTPAQITSLIAQPGGSAAIVTGLAGQATSLAGGTPSTASVDGLVGQVTALLGGGLPTVPGTDGLLSTVDGLLRVTGLDTSALTGLLGVSTVALHSAAPGTDTTALSTVIRTLSSVLGVPAPGGGGTPPPPRPPAPAARPSAGTNPAVGAGFFAFRATLSALKVAKNRGSLKLTVSCPAIAPKGCLVTLKGAVAGKKAFADKQVIVMRTLKSAVTLKLTKAVASRLKKKGGSLKVTAQTSFSSLAATTKTVKVAKPKVKRKSTR